MTMDIYSLLRSDPSNGLDSAAADEIDRLRADLKVLNDVLIQIREVCDDNAAASCNQAMALAFVRSVADAALTSA